MAQCSINDAPVLSLRLDMPLRGPWTAEVELDRAEAPTGQAILLFESSEDDAKVQFVGTVRESGTYGGRSRAWIVGGAGGLRTPLPHRSYVDSPTARLVAVDIAREAGEALAAGVEDELLTHRVDSWLRLANEGGAELAALADRLGLAWRVRFDGSLWVGREEWPPYSATRNIPQPISGALEDGVAVFAPPLPTLVPGVNLDGARIGRVVYTIDQGLRATVTFLEAGTTVDREGTYHRDATLSALPALALHLLYEGTVISQAGDGTLEVDVADATIGPLSRVPIWLGLPGCTVEVDKGARVMVGFMGGRRDARYASLWATDASATKITIVADSIELAEGTPLAVARQTDPVQAGPYAGTITTGSTKVTSA